MNTKISYLYRDASNHKVYNECIVRGLLTEEQTRTILDCRDGDNFIPSQVGLPERRFDRYDPEEDHCWFELQESGFEPTDAEADVDLFVEELVSNFLARKDRWDDTITPTVAYEPPSSSAPSPSRVFVHSYQFEARLYYKDPRFDLDVCSTAEHTQIPAGIADFTEFDLAYAANKYLAQLHAMQGLAEEGRDFDLLLEAEQVGWDESDRMTVFGSRLRTDHGSLTLEPMQDPLYVHQITGIPMSELPQALAYAWGGFFAKVRELSPHDLDNERVFADLAAFHDGHTGKEWLRKADAGELHSDLSDLIAKAQKTFTEIAKGDPQQPAQQKTPER